MENNPFSGCANLDLINKSDYYLVIDKVIYDKDKKALGLTNNTGTDYYEGMTIPTKANTSFINITIRKNDLTDIKVL